MSAEGGKILVIRGGAIGDFILTLPALAALRRQFSTCQLEVLGYPHIAQLALAGELVDAVRSIEARALAGFFARRGQLDEDLSDYFSEFSLILSYLYDPDGIFRVNVARCSPAQFLQGPHRPDEKSNQHATEAFLKPLEQLAIFDADTVPRLKVGRASAQSRCEGIAEEAEDRRDASPALALHPGSGSERKNWPEAHWAELIHGLVSSTEFDFLLVGGEAEGDRLERLSRLAPADRLRLARNLPLPELARQLQPCAAFVGHDSGITHLAAAVGLRGLVLWGDSSESVWRPKSRRMIILRASDGLSKLSVQTVVESLSNLFSSDEDP